MKRDRGIILVNVLVALALGAAIIVLMFTSQETLVDRSRRAAGATQAEALALGAEASVVTALRRDKRTAPETDNQTEPWAQAAQQAVQLQTGRFAVQIEDAQGRFNLNLLTSSDLVHELVLDRLLAVLELPAELAADIKSAMRRRDPPTGLDQIETLSAEARGLLAPNVGFLPIPGIVNVNAAPPAVLTAVVGNPGIALRLLKLRERQGFLTPDDVLSTGLIALTDAAYTSDVFDVTATAEVDGTTTVLHSRLLRQERLDRVFVRVVSRRFGNSPSVGSVALPEALPVLQP